MSMPPVPPPMPVIPVNPPYATALPLSGNVRPGAVTAIGVLSIILAIVQGIAAVSWCGFAFTSMVTAQMQQAQAAAMNMAPFAATAEPDDAPKGLPDSVASTVVQALGRRHRTSERRQAHVRTLLTRQGKELFPYEDEWFTPQRVAAQVHACGAMGDKADYYEIGRGRLEVTDQQALFRASDGKVFRSTDPAVDRALSEAQIEQALTQLRWQMSDRPSPTQENALRVKLRDPTQTLLRAGETPSSAGLTSDQTWWFVTSTNQVRIDASGTLTTLNLSAPVPGVNPNSGKPISTFWAGLTMLDAAVTGALAIVLLIAGIFLLRGRPIGRRMHFWWAWAKIPLALLGAMVCGFAVAEWMGMMPPANPGSPPPVALGGWSTGITSAALGIAYPVVLLIVLTRPRVRTYFANVG